ncbi:MAG: hypothetical protein GX825_03415, partial [Syntrophomonadaceae bacterium]|nr:hypothetical protein [Syntrophomonadaceae bacterium]
KRVLYAGPTKEQTDAYWYEVCKILAPLIDNKVLVKNESERYIEKPGTTSRIKAKTAWDAQSMRGDWAEKVILDEYQMMNEDAWSEVCQPMLADKNGDALFFFTPPSLANEGRSKARDPMHASKLYKKYLGVRDTDPNCIWECFHFTSWDNPFISKDALTIIAADMSLDTYRREIMALDDEVQNSWLVYPQFNESMRKVSRFAIPKHWPVFTGHDFGKANPACLFVAQCTEPYKVDELHLINKGDYVIFREYAPGSRTIAQHVGWFKEYTAGYNVFKSVGGNQTTEDEIRQGYMAHGWPITAPIIGKVNTQIERDRGLFGLNKIWIFNDLIGLLSQLSSCMFRLDDTNRPLNEIKDEPKYHYLACLRYLFSDFVPETNIFGKLKIKRFL